MRRAVRRGVGRPLGQPARQAPAIARIVAVLTALGLAGCGSMTGTAKGSTTSHRVEYYLSLGDSYAAGYQPIAAAFTHRDHHGFAYQVPGLARHEGYRFELLNFACDGATTSTVIAQDGCSLPAPGPDDQPYPDETQAGAAERFLSAHRGRVGLVTVSIGGNDLLGCTSAAIFLSCLRSALPGIRGRLRVLLAGLRRAAGKRVPIVGVTYPDVFLALYGSTSLVQRDLALVSVTAFKTLFNPALEAGYHTIGARFVDVTRATGGYLPLSRMAPGSKGRKVPEAVTEVCSLTYYCREGDVHPTTAGYALIARLVVATLAQLR